MARRNIVERYSRATVISGLRLFLITTRHLTVFLMDMRRVSALLSAMSVTSTEDSSWEIAALEYRLPISAISQRRQQLRT